MAHLPTVEDVAALAGVSRQTVSNVLNAPQVVRAATRERVEHAIAALGYRPHASARRLRTRRSSTIGIRLDTVGDGITGSIIDRYLHALTERAEAHELRITLFTARDPEHEIAQYRRLRDGADVDGFVVTSTRRDDPRAAWLIAEGLPFVSFGRPWDSASLADPAWRWVDVDGRAGARAATEHLLGRGLRRIGYLGWPAGSGTGDDRRRGWVEAMTAAGADDADLAALAVETEDGVALARAATERLLRDGVELDALVCASDTIGLGAMMAAREARRPEFPIIGFDNAPVARAVGMSSIDQRLDEVAAATLELLVPALERSSIPDDAPHHRLVEPRLVVRRSSHLAPVEETGGTESSESGRAVDE